MGGRTDIATRAMQRGTAAHYENQAFGFMTEEDVARADALKPLPFSWRGAKSCFYDYIITPRATFHTRDEIVRWAGQNGLELLEYDQRVGNLHAFFFRRTT